MAFTAKEAYEIRQFAKHNLGIHPMQRKFNQLVDETIGTASGGFPTTTTTTTTTSSTTTTTA